MRARAQRRWRQRRGRQPRPRQKLAAPFSNFPPFIMLLNVWLVFDAKIIWSIVLHAFASFCLFCLIGWLRVSSLHESIIVYVLYCGCVSISSSSSSFFLLYTVTPIFCCIRERRQCAGMIWLFCRLAVAVRTSCSLPFQPSPTAPHRTR